MHLLWRQRLNQLVSGLTPAEKASEKATKAAATATKKKAKAVDLEVESRARRQRQGLL